MLYRTEFRAMGCQMMAALDTASARGRERLAETRAWFEQWEQCLSRFRKDSELSLINQGGGGAVSPVLWQVFRASLEAERLSGGLVNPLVLQAVCSAGYTESFERLPQMATGGAPSQLSPAAVEVPSLSSVTFDEQRHILYLPDGVGLDFGGIAKGWAAHQAMHRLQGYGPALVDAGGDIAVSGLQPGGRPWLVGVASPYEADAHLARLAVGRCGIATSGRDFRRWQDGRGAQHHLIDPLSGQPAETDVLAATVIAADVLQAETAAKTALILGSQAGLHWLEGQPGLAGLLALESGQVLQTSGFARYVVNN